MASNAYRILKQKRTPLPNRNGYRRPLMELTRARVRWICAADRCFWGGSSASPICRRSGAGILGPWVAGRSAEFQLDVSFLFMSCVQQASVEGPRSPCLEGGHSRGTRHQEAQHGRPDAPSQVAVRPSSWPREGPLGSSRAALVTKRWPVTSHRPNPVQHRAMCCILGQGAAEWHQVGAWGPLLVFSGPSRDNSGTAQCRDPDGHLMDIKPMHDEIKPRGHTNVKKCMISRACIHLFPRP